MDYKDFNDIKNLKDYNHMKQLSHGTNMRLFITFAR